MNSWERVATALQHETPDRCPFQASFTPEFAARLRAHVGLSDDSQHNPHGGGNTYALERAIGEDMLLTSVGWANGYYQDTKPYVDEWAVGWDAQPYDTPFGRGHYTEITTHPLADENAIARYQPPDPAAPGRYDAARQMIADFGGDYWIVGVTVTTVFETAWALRGLEQLLLDMALEPDLADAVLEIPYRFHRAAAEELTRLGVDMIWLGDDVGAQQRMLMSPAMWRRFLKPRMAELIAAVKAINPAVKVAYHSDGNILPVIPELIEIGLDVLNPIQPASMDPAAVKKAFGQHLSFWGVIDEQHTLPFGAPADVAREVELRLQTIGRGGGLILAPTHNVQLDTPLPNFWALVKTVHNTPYPARATASAR
jgi:uroporphyrinogen decarboxylase